MGALHCTLGVMSLLKTDELSQAKAFLESLDVPSLLAKAVEGEMTDADPATKQALTSCSVSEPLVIHLKGLQSMHPPEKTSILYSAPTDLSERLYPFCLAVQKLFNDKGLLVEDDRKLKLHATIVNTIYAKGRRPPSKTSGKPSAERPPGSGSGGTVSTNLGASGPQQDDGSVQGHGPRANAPLKIDARALLDEYQDFVWTDNVSLDRLTICEMGAKKVTDAGGNVIAERYTEVASIALPT